MKQLLQDLSKGGIEIVETPSPLPARGMILIKSTVSLVSAGTERMLLEFGRGNYLQKARQQPEKVKMVFDKIGTDGIMATYEAVRARLDKPITPGYSSVGVVVEAGDQGSEDSRFKPGDRVVSNGPHAGIVRVPENLCARIPPDVSDEAAAFTVVGAVGLQGIRLAGPTLGEAFVVTGVGLIGLITVQLLRAHGCRVLAVDFDPIRLEMARGFGAEICNPAGGEDPVAAGMAFSRGRGVDGVIICAATRSGEPISQAAGMCRKRGRIVLVGVTDLKLNRSDFYEKELTFQVSCSYGPGRYDPEYEEKGHDYPFGFVRWTEARNFEAVLDMMADGRLDVNPLITHRFVFEEAGRAYDLLAEEKEPYLGILLQYGKQATEAAERGADQRSVRLRPDNGRDKHVPGRPLAGFIGAGNYASRVLIPAFRAAGANLRTIVTSGGTSGVVCGRKAGFAYASTDAGAMLADERINTVVIATRHNTHADFVTRALEAGKHVFVEKPLCLTLKELEKIRAALPLPAAAAQPLLMVGFNRRFAPQVQKMKALLEPIRQPRSFIMTMNAGEVPADHWTRDRSVGGGRIIGEACHCIDLMRFLAGCEIVSFQAMRMGAAPGAEAVEDKASIMLRFADGSFGTVHYLANGSADFPKERIEVFAAGRVLQLDNFRRLRGFGWPGFRKMNLWRQDKGQAACAAAFVDAIRQGGPAPIAVEEIFEVAGVVIEVDALLQSVAAV